MQQEGARGFYRGFLPSILTSLPSSGAWFGMYGFVRHALMERFPAPAPVSELHLPLHDMALQSVASVCASWCEHYRFGYEERDGMMDERLTYEGMWCLLLCFMSFCDSFLLFCDHFMSFFFHFVSVFYTFPPYSVLSRPFSVLSRPFFFF